jgi:protein CpxP
MPAFRPFFIALASTLALASSAHAQGPDLQALHNTLNLTPAQETAWSAFAAASARDPEQAARDRAAQSMLATLSAPQRVDLTIAAMQADLRTLERRGEALKTFYATLSPAQQILFDRETAPNGEDER